MGFQSVDEVDLTEVFEVPALVMKSIPKFMRGAFRGALKLSLQEIHRGSVANKSIVEARGWKLFSLLPRSLVFRPPRGGLVPRGRLQERLAPFVAGDCVFVVVVFGSVDAGGHHQSQEMKKTC